MNRSEICRWCKKTDALIPIVQGGPVHTMCPECGTNGPVLGFSELRESYLGLLSQVKRLENIAELAAEYLAAEKAYDALFHVADIPNQSDWEERVQDARMEVDTRGAALRTALKDLGGEG